VKVDSVDSVKRRVALSLPAAESTDSPGEDAEDYSKYMEPAPPPQTLGSLGEALKRSWSGKRNRRKRLRSDRLQVEVFEEVRHLAAPPWPVVVDVVPQKSIHAGISFAERIACRSRVSATISSSHAPARRTPRSGCGGTGPGTTGR